MIKLFPDFSSPEIYKKVTQRHLCGKNHNLIHQGLMFAHRQLSSAELMALCQVRVVSSHHRTILPLGTQG